MLTRGPCDQVNMQTKATTIGFATFPPQTIVAYKTTVLVSDQCGTPSDDMQIMPPSTPLHIYTNMLISVHYFNEEMFCAEKHHAMVCAAAAVCP